LGRNEEEKEALQIGRRFPVQRRCEKTLKRRRKKKTNWGRKKKRRFLFPKGKNKERRARVK
jgi:hypothetical protein